MLSFLLETGLRTGTYLITHSIYYGVNGVSYLIYGPTKDPVLQKLENLERRLEESNSKDRQYYWASKKIHQYQSNYWVVISNQKLLIQAPKKSTALRVIADYQEQNTDPDLCRCLLIQVGQENNSHYL